jgi:hypothetical protein
MPSVSLRVRASEGDGIVKKVFIAGIAPGSADAEEGVTVEE